MPKNMLIIQIISILMCNVNLCPFFVENSSNDDNFFERIIYA